MIGGDLPVRRLGYGTMRLVGDGAWGEPAGSANPSPPIGPALGQRGLNIMEFCKSFNAQTQKLEKGRQIWW